MASGVGDRGSVASGVGVGGRGSRVSVVGGRGSGVEVTYKTFQVTYKTFQLQLAKTSSSGGIQTGPLCRAFLPCSPNLFRCDVVVILNYFIHKPDYLLSLLLYIRCTFFHDLYLYIGFVH